ATATPTPVDSSATSNAGEEQVPVPDLRGKTEEEAQQTANEMGLGVTSGGTEPSDSVEAGKICRQDLQPGSQVAKNSTITYYVSAGSGKVEIPTGLIGKPRNAVQAALNKVGLEVSFTEDFSSDVPADSVIALDPGEGS